LNSFVREVQLHVAPGFENMHFANVEAALLKADSLLNEAHQYLGGTIAEKPNALSALQTEPSRQAMQPKRHRSASFHSSRRRKLKRDATLRESLQRRPVSRSAGERGADGKDA
jgi:hypothetical protein